MIWSLKCRSMFCWLYLNCISKSFSCLYYTSNQGVGSNMEFTYPPDWYFVCILWLLLDIDFQWNDKFAIIHCIQMALYQLILNWSNINFMLNDFVYILTIWLLCLYSTWISPCNKNCNQTPISFRSVIDPSNWSIKPVIASRDHRALNIFYRFRCFICQFYTYRHNALD